MTEYERLRNERREKAGKAPVRRLQHSLHKDTYADIEHARARAEAAATVRGWLPHAVFQR